MCWPSLSPSLRFARTSQSNESASTAGANKREKPQSSTLLHSTTCDYGNLKEDMIKDCLVVDIRDKVFSECLQLEAVLTLEKTKTAINTYNYQVYAFIFYVHRYNITSEWTLVNALVNTTLHGRWSTGLIVTRSTKT